MPARGSGAVARRSVGVRVAAWKPQEIDMIRLHTSVRVLALASVMGSLPAMAADLPEIVVEANAPTVHVSKHHEASMPGGASVDLLQVRYHVHLKGLDLAKQADVAKLDELIKEAAVKGCDTIKQQYPLATPSGPDTCVADAVKSADAQRKAALAAAMKK